jgi:hypothetical protein
MAETLLMVTIQCGDFADTLKIVENKLLTAGAAQ